MKRSVNIKNEIKHIMDTDIRVTLYRNGYPDVVIEYIPEISLIAVIGNFGGLLGMWLGVSVLSSLDITINMTKQFRTLFIKYFYNNINIVNVRPILLRNS